MKKSRKGICLNDAQCFNQPLPHTRKRMTKIQIIQFKNNLINDQMSVKKNVKENVRINRSNGIDKDQPSTEMTHVTFKKYNNDNDNNNNHHHDVSCVTCNPDQIQNQNQANNKSF